ncbi:hypothetical protein ACEYW6_10415 [Nostoc sp. UIC 10607]|uniref:hypothetical protein n=1 Tax=Nostoc sp. UIC 10607 TaxID=3045935 RepID=UPI0039A0F3D1
MLKMRREAIKKLYKAYELIREVEDIACGYVLWPEIESGFKCSDKSKENLLNIISEIARVDDFDLETLNEESHKLELDIEKVKVFAQSRSKRRRYPFTETES